MNPNEFIKYLHDPSITASQTLRELIDSYPFFESARILYLANLAKEDSPEFEEELDKTALFVSDRSVLRKRVNGDFGRSVREDQYESESIPEPVNEVQSTSEPEIIEKEKPAPSKKDLIDEFIKNEPRISKPRTSFFNPVEAASTSIVDKENIVSETLARIYADQGNFEKARRLYEKLSLKYPEKSSYFAALISKTKEQQKSK